MPPMFAGCQIAGQLCMRCGRLLRLLAAPGRWFACPHCDTREDGR
jgi:hypothetical protein